MKGYKKKLRTLAEKVDLNTPGSVEEHILGLERKNKYKSNLFTAYLAYCEANGIKWRRPKGLRIEAYPVKVPTEERIDQITSSCTNNYSTIFSVSKYGLRPDEVGKIQLRDIDLGTGELVVRTSKLGLGRTLRLDPRTLDKVRDHVSCKRVDRLDERLFPNGEKISDRWRHYRRKAYERLRDPELLKIRLYDLRHWYGTKKYLETRDIFRVKYLMGHRHIQSTLVYIHVAEGLVNYSEDYTSRVAATVEEARELVEAGFEYMVTHQDAMIFRKRK